MAGVDTSQLLESLKIPSDIYVGLKFNSHEEAKECYDAYAIRQGFKSRTAHTENSKSDGRRISMDFVCSREGKKSGKKSSTSNIVRDEIRIGCGALMRIKFREDKWEVTRFVKEHNHELLSPKSSKLNRGQRKITPAQKNLIDRLNKNGVSAGKIAAAINEDGIEFGPVCIAQDVNNYLSNKKRKICQDGDAQRMLQYFKECVKMDPKFVYTIEKDDNGRMGNCFWAGGRSIEAYKYFGDAVTFDATYMTNCYDMPFVPFTGVNHHGHSVMFGCALLNNETIESYTWLLMTWLSAMGGKAPKTIITDEDKAMSRAISNVLSTTVHYLCMWHLLQKMPERLASVIHEFPQFKETFNYCVHKTRTVAKFENGWRCMLEEYRLVKNKWLEDLYNKREKWVPAYVRQHFCAGMSTTQRSESMNKYFKDYVKGSTRVSDFVYEYSKALRAQCIKEKSQDVKTKSSRPPLKTFYKMEKLASIVYTRKVFKRFQNELCKSQKFRVEKIFVDEYKDVYSVKDREKEDSSIGVEWHKSSGTGKCECHMMEFVGIMCRHIAAVMVKQYLVDEFPEVYIMDRWRAWDRDEYHRSLNENLSFMSTDLEECRKKDNAYRMFERIVTRIGKSEKRYSFVMNGLENMVSQLEKIIDDAGEDVVNEPQATNTGADQACSSLLTDSQDTLLDPCSVKSRGRPRSLRYKNPKEVLVGAKSKRRKKNNEVQCTDQPSVVTTSIPINASPLEVSNQFQYAPPLEVRQAYTMSPDFGDRTSYMELLMGVDRDVIGSSQQYIHLTDAVTPGDKENGSSRTKSLSETANSCG